MQSSPIAVSRGRGAAGSSDLVESQLTSSKAGRKKKKKKISSGQNTRRIWKDPGVSQQHAFRTVPNAIYMLYTWSWSSCAQLPSISTCRDLNNGPSISNLCLSHLVTSFLFFFIWFKQTVRMLFLFLLPHVCVDNSDVSSFCGDLT